MPRRTTKTPRCRPSGAPEGSDPNFCEKGSDYVYLLKDRAVVGTGRLFFKPGGAPREYCKKIDGELLSRFCNGLEDLVSIYHVQIFSGFEDVAYPYGFGGPEEPPKILGELNTVGKGFKRIVAWDRFSMKENPSGTDLAEVPRVVNAPEEQQSSPFQRSEFVTGIRRFVVSSPQRTSRRHSLTAAVPTASSIDIDVDDIQPNQGNPLGLSRSDSGHLAQRTANSLPPRIAGKPISSIRRSPRKKRSISYVLPSDSDSERSDKPDRSPDYIGDDPQSGIKCLNPRVTTVRPDSPFRQMPFTDVPHGEEPRSVAADAENIDEHRQVRSSGPPRRIYSFKNRQKAPPRALSNLRKRRLQNSKRRDNSFLSPRECCKRLCFSQVDPLYAFAQYKRIMCMDRENEKRTLVSMFHPDEYMFKFNGQHVCARFLQRGFEFSSTLQSCVKGTEKAPASASIKAVPRERRTASASDEIVCFLETLAQNTGDQIPNRPYINLPLLTKRQVYEKYAESVRRSEAGDSSQTLASESYFFNVWRKSCSNIRTRKHHGFAKCSVCESFRSELAQCANDESKAAELNRQRNVHLKMVETEKRAYYMRRNQAKLYPTKYLSIIIDGADQKSYGLPHFAYNSKADRGHKIRVKCVGVIEHRSRPRLSLYTMTEEFATGANHVIETVHRTLTRKQVSDGKLPPVGYIQVDNCTRENKNKFFLSYFELLVALGVFVEVQVSFLPVGHTHEDIDQAFSRIAQRLKITQAVTMTELLKEMESSFTPQPVTSELLQLVNYSGLCEVSNCLAAVKQYSHFRYFQFSRSAGEIEYTESHMRAYKTTCNVKVLCSDEWQPLPGAGGAGFLTSVPNFNKTPLLHVRAPEDIAEINKCLNAAEERVRDESKMGELRRLRDRVYRNRQIDFHWDMQVAIESNGEYKPQDSIVEPSEKDQDVSDMDGIAEEEPLANLKYSSNDFVAVNAEDNSCPFWIAKVMEIAARDAKGVITTLRVRWYEADPGSNDPYQASYSAAFEKFLGRRRPWMDNIHVNTVYCRLSSLSQKRKIKVHDANAIRQILGTN